MKSVQTLGVIAAGFALASMYAQADVQSTERAVVARQPREVTRVTTKETKPIARTTRTEVTTVSTAEFDELVAKAERQEKVSRIWDRMPDPVKAFCAKMLYYTVRARMKLRDTLEWARTQVAGGTSQPEHA